MATKSLGSVTVTTVVELERPNFKAGNLLPQLTPELVEENADWLVPRHYLPEDDLLVMPVQSFLVKTPHHTILVDGCFGNAKHITRPSPEFSGLDEPWLERLAEAGAEPDDIDFVMCSHLHADHIGWNTRLENGRWVPTFPNAKYVFARSEWDFWQEMARTGERPTEQIEESVVPIVEAGQSEMVDGEHEIEDGIMLMPLPGHTPGHMGVHIRASDGEAVLTGDMIHHPLQIHYPDWTANACVDKPLSHKTRTTFIREYADTGTYIVPAHFPAPVCGLIESAGESFKWHFDE